MEPAPAPAPVALPPAPSFAFSDRTLRATLPVPVRAVGVAGLLSGVAFEVLFDGPELGLSVPLFQLVMVALLASMTRRAGKKASALSQWAAGLGLVFAALVAVRASPVLTFCNLSVATVLTLTAFAVHRHATSQAPGPFRALGLAVGASLGGLSELPQLARASVAELHERRQLDSARRLLRGSLLALPILALFTVLLTSADRVFAAHVSAALEAALSVANPLRLMVVTVSGTLLAAILVRACTPAKALPALPTKPASRYLSAGEVMGLLVLLDVLFAAFVLSQLVSVGRAAGLSASELSERARHGFFQLLTVTVLSLGLLLVLDRMGQRNTAGERRSFLAASTAMVLLVFGIVAIAAQRMLHYEEAYGFTELRVYSHAFIFLIAAVLGLRLLTFFWRPGFFAVGTGVLMLAALAVLNVLNPDDFIARRDLGSAHADFVYLRGLSDDALPTLARRALPPQFAQTEDSCDHGAVDPVGCHLGFALQAYANESAKEEHHPLAGAHLARSRAARALIRFGGLP